MKRKVLATLAGLLAVLILTGIFASCTDGSEQAEDGTTTVKTDSGDMPSGTSGKPDDTGNTTGSSTESEFVSESGSSEALPSETTNKDEGWSKYY